MTFMTTVTRMWLTRSLNPFVFQNEYDDKLPYLQTENLGLYVHIPFCRTICGFCPYCKTKYEPKLANRYVDALISEIHMVGTISSQPKKVTSLYFGGGSPALIANRLNEIICAIKKHFIITEGIGIELHPDDVNTQVLTALKQAGITKISIGIQSFQNEYLHILGRKTPDYYSICRTLSTIPFDTVSMDFIFALPGQTFEQLKKDIDTAFLTGANHIAIYPFIDFSFAKNSFKKMKEKKKRQLLNQITNYCIQNGYVRDSIWTFTKQNVQKYSSMTRENFLGFGCSATTLLEKQFKINTFSVESYIDRINSKNPATSLTLRFKRRQRMIYYLFWAFYTTRLNPDDFEKFFGVTLKSQYGFELFLARLFGYITEKNGIYELTLKGAYYFHYYEKYYTLSYIDQMWGTMRKVAFPEKITF